MREASKTEYIACPLCQSSDYRNILTKFEMNIVKCKKCGLIYVNPILQELELSKRYTRSFFFNEYLPIFKANSTHYDLNVIRSHFFLYLQLLTKYLTSEKRLLDVGCGAGFFIKASEEIGWEVEGVEISTIASEYAQNIVKVKVHKGKLEELNFPAEEFDLVVLMETIEHLTNPLNTLMEINRILKEEGILIISAPDYNSLSRLFLRKNWAVLSPAEHLSFFTQKTLLHILQKANFCVLGIRNLLQFNPEYTHNKERLGYFVFKNLYKKMKNLKMVKKAQLFEYADIMLIEDKKQIKTQNTYLILSSIAKMKRIIYKWTKTWLRGDTLVAIAKKKMET